MLRLKAQRVPIEKNILSLVFGIGTEARLLHTCKVYSATLPCFQDKIKECGDEKQKRILNEVSKTIIYLCSPFSMQRQKLVLENQKCISGVLSLPASAGCQLDDNKYGQQVLACKRKFSNLLIQLCAILETVNSLIKNMIYYLVLETSSSASSNKIQNANSRKIAPEKKGKTQYRRPIPKSKTEIQEHPLVLTSPSTRPTADNIYIAPPGQIPPNVYMMPQKPNLPSANVTNNIASLYPGQESLKTSVWKKGDYGQKVQYNKEHWRQKTTSGELLFTTQHPLFTTTSLGATPRRHKVIDILKSLIPPNLPSQLTALLENSYDKETFPETQSYNTPAISPNSEIYATSEAVAQPEIYTFAPPPPPPPSPQIEIIPPKPVKSLYRPVHTTPTTAQPIVHYQVVTELAATKKWKPWYLGGA
uniref:Uncharacterized protein n=1 Tax=Caenorhabditis japonica TaxID=281687 RepID=A0A8R1HUD8_CAEJA